MKSFATYVKLKEMSLPPDDDRDNKSHSQESEMVAKIAQLAWKKHNGIIRELFRKLSRLDAQIAAEYAPLDKKIDDQEYNGNPFGEKDTINRAVADTQAGPEFDNN